MSSSSCEGPLSVGCRSIAGRAASRHTRQLDHGGFDPLTLVYWRRRLAKSGRADPAGAHLRAAERQAKPVLGRDGRTRLGLRPQIWIRALRLLMPAANFTVLDSPLSVPKFLVMFLGR
jgi:hypothetical protein